MVSRRLLVLNFEGVITTNPDPYALFIVRVFFHFFFVFERDCNLCKFLKRNESLFLISN